MCAATPKGTSDLRQLPGDAWHGRLGGAPTALVASAATSPSGGTASQVPVERTCPRGARPPTTCHRRRRPCGRRARMVGAVRGRQARDRRGGRRRVAHASGTRGRSSTRGRRARVGDAARKGTRSLHAREPSHGAHPAECDSHRLALSRARLSRKVHPESEGGRVAQLAHARVRDDDRLELGRVVQRCAVIVRHVRSAA